jgi:hypothetical protein
MMRVAARRSSVHAAAPAPWSARRAVRYTGIAGLLLMLAGSLALGGDAPFRRVAPVTQDLLYYGAGRPIIIRLHLFLDGKPSGDVWQHYVERLFALADRDGDGVLTEAELQLAAELDDPLREELQAVLTSSDLLQADIAPPDGTLSLEEFAAVVADRRGRPFQPPANMGGTPSGTTLLRAPMSASNASDLLFRSLDTSQDRRLSLEELSAAPTSVRRLDLDRDGTTSVDELDHLRSPFMGVAGGGETRGAVPLH